MRRKHNNDKDYMSNKMDRELERMEKEISSLYSNVSKEIQQDFQKFTDTFQKEDDAQRAKVDAGVISEQEYSLWRQRKIVQSDLYKSKLDSMSKTLVKTDQAAMAIINGKLPSVVAQSYNFVSALGFNAAKKAGISAGTFQVYNARSVQGLMKGKNVLKPNVDVDEDIRWNRDHINKAITTSIVKGDSIPKTADRLQGVTNMDRNSAIRNARTAMTSAENMGRAEAADDLKEKGIPVEEVWSATYDSRTRDTHLMLDGTVRDEDGLFGVGIINTPLRYPADPEGDPEEIYNCRCRMNIQIKGIDHSNDEELYKQFMQENYSQDWENLQNNQHYQDMQTEKEAALDRKDRLLEEKRASEPVVPAPAETQKPEMPINVREAYDKFADKYMDAKVEHGMLFSKDGELISESTSKRGTSVSIASESIYRDMGEGAFEIHNHTANELYSSQDIKNYEYYGMNGTITTTEGMEYTLYNTNKPIWDLDDTEKVKYNSLAGAWSKATEEINEQWRMDRRMVIDENESMGLDRDSARKRLREWEEANSRIGRQERWLEEHSEEYGFIFEKRNIRRK